VWRGKCSSCPENKDLIRLPNLAAQNFTPTSLPEFLNPIMGGHRQNRIDSHQFLPEHWALTPGPLSALWSAFLRLCAIIVHNLASICPKAILDIGLLAQTIALAALAMIWHLPRHAGRLARDYQRPHIPESADRWPSPSVTPKPRLR
jgi:hypothetical protein